MIYIDDPRPTQRNSSHLLSDSSLEELHEFAEKLEIKREWFHPKSSPHYDLFGIAKWRKAISLGATKADAKKVVEIIKFWREEARKK